MRKGTDLVGKPIIAFDTGKHVDTVEDLIFDQHTNQLLGFLVDEGGWRGTARVVPLGGVQAIGPDAVIVPSAVVIIDAERVPDIQQILQRDNVLKGKKIFTTDGRDLGTMVDLYFDERTGRIEGYEVSGGVFADEHTGRSFVPAPESFAVGDDVAFVPPEVAGLMEERAGGEAGGPGPEVTQDLASATREALAGAPGAGALGRRTRRAVRTSTGVIVAAPGQIVTAQTLDRARELGLEEDLLAAAGLGEATPGGEAPRDAPGHFWDRVKGKFGEFTALGGGDAEDRRVRSALGRPVTRVILDEQDNAILNVGEIITHRAVAMARASGALEMLLDSVYDGEPAIRGDELRAPEPGDASLDAVDGRRAG